MVAADRQQRAEVCCQNARGREARRIEMIREHVEELGAQLELRLLPQPEILKERDITGPLPGGAQRVAPRITQRSQRRRGEDRRVELLDVSSLEAVRQGIS